jgi:hypothetical protein
VFSSTDGVAPLSATGQNYLSDWTTYHQKTSYYCLPAVAQSMLAWNFGTATYVGSSVKTSQTNIAQSMGTNSGGTDDYRGLAYVNGQFDRWNSLFTYVPANDTTLAAFETRVADESDVYFEPLYVRVDVTSTYYVWHQTHPALHATAAVGYLSSGAEVDIADPFTASSSGCPERIGYPGYSSTPDIGCIYFAYSTSYYYKAKSPVVDSEKPEWY